jgi:hypothetical protein
MRIYNSIAGSLSLCKNGQFATSLQFYSAYSRVADYTYAEYLSLLQADFDRWISQNNLDFRANSELPSRRPVYVELESGSGTRWQVTAGSLAWYLLYTTTILIARTLRLGRCLGFPQKPLLLGRSIWTGAIHVEQRHVVARHPRWTHSRRPACRRALPPREARLVKVSPSR